MPRAEGELFPFVDQSHIRPDFLETFEFDSPDQYIKTETHEFVAVCPFSGLPDVGHLIIEYYPQGGRCIELKSLKYYITSFRNVGIYQEEATRRIYEDLKAALHSPRIRVTTVYNVRGGFLTTAVQGSLQDES
jgi:7-cyano-7-deazaguanine reductase